MGVVDVEPGSVSQDHVGRTDFVGVNYRYRSGHPAQIKATSITQR